MPNQAGDARRFKIERSWNFFVDWETLELIVWVANRWKNTNSINLRESANLQQDGDENKDIGRDTEAQPELFSYQQTILDIPWFKWLKHQMWMVILVPRWNEEQVLDFKKPLTLIAIKF